MRVLEVLVVLCASSVVSCSAYRDDFSTPGAALLIIDVQDCFLPGGSLEVPQGEEVIPVINEIRRQSGQYFKAIVLSQDFHCPHHVSFASTNPSHDAGDTLDLQYSRQSGALCEDEQQSVTVDNYRDAQNCSGDDTMKISQRLWPDHCIAHVNKGPASSDFSQHLIIEPNDIIIRKGTHCDVDSYSAFYDVTQRNPTDLQARLNEHYVTSVYIAGLALDYCVKYTALDARRLGYDTYVIWDATRGVSPNKTETMEILLSQGVNLISSYEVGRIVLTEHHEYQLYNSGYKHGNQAIPFGFLYAIAVAVVTHFVRG